MSYLFNPSSIVDIRLKFLIKSYCWCGSKFVRPPRQVSSVELTLVVNKRFTCEASRERMGI